MSRTEQGGAARKRSCALLLIASLGLAGCFPPKVGDSADPNCGIFYDCGSHSDPNQGGGQTATGTSNNNSNSNSNGNTGDDTTTDGE